MTERSKVFIEKVKVDERGFFISSDIVYPTSEQIEEFTKRGCEHSLHKDKLVYDEAGWPYDLRHCAFCGTFLGTI
jgi:hypothetical protein